MTRFRDAPPVQYRAGYKYQLAHDFAILLGAPFRGYDRKSEFIVLAENSVLGIRAGYAWDGASGMTVDTPSTFAASLVHDALYQLLREKRLPPHLREAADQVLYDLLVARGMWAWRAKLWHRAVRKAAAGAARPENARPVHVA